MGEIIIQHWEIVSTVVAVGIGGAFAFGMLLGRTRTRLTVVEEKIKTLFELYNREKA